MKTQKVVSILRSALFLSLFFISNKLAAQVQTAKYVSMTSQSNGYYEYLPAGYSSGSNVYPLIIFITGIGELGDGSAGQLPKVLNNGTPKQIAEGIFPTSFTVNSKSYSFIVLSPQFTDWPGYGAINDIIDYATRNYRVDVSRIYLTGLSMGGGVVWEYAGNNSTYANRLAAIVPIAGASYPDATRSQIIAASNLPVWATHNDNDPTVSSSNTIGYVNNINSAPTPPNPLAKKTIFSSSSHDAWTATYDLNFRENGLNVYEWMLQYQRGSTSQLPVASAGSDITIQLPVNSVQLNGSGSYAAKGRTLVDFTWTKISGPAQFTISNNKIANPTFSNLVEGTYTLRLTVTDDIGGVAWDDVNIYVNTASGNKPPVANAGGDLSITLPVNSIQLNGAGSSDPDGTIASYSWAKIAGPTSFTISDSRIINPVFSNLVAGTYTLRLTVTDNSGATATDDVNVVVNPAVPPTGQPIPGKIEAESFTSKNSLKTETTTDVGGGLNVGGLGSGSWMDYYVNVATAGTYTVNYRIATPYSGTQLQLKKSDGTVLSTVNLPLTNGWQSWTTVASSVTLPAGSQTLRVYVNVPSFNFNWFEFTNGTQTNQSPVADAGPDVTITLPVNSVTLTGSGTDPDGSIASYLWSQVSGPSTATIGSKSGNQTLMSNLIEGKYVFELKVTDNKGASATNKMELVVKPSTGGGGTTKYINVNVYGGSNPYVNSAWNNWNVGTGAGTNITSGLFTYSDGTTSGINAVLSYSQAMGDNATSYQGGMAPKEVLRYTSYSRQARTLTISGLSTTTKYSIELYASRWSTGNTTIFTVNGTSVTITTYRNFTNKAVFADVTPTAQGQIVVSMKSGSTYNYLNGFMITQQGTTGGRPENIAQPASTNSYNESSAEVEDETTSINIVRALSNNLISLEAYPNPVTDKVTMQVTNSSLGIMNVEISNASGAIKKQLSLKHTSPVSQINIPMNELPAGVYIIKVQIGSWFATKRVIKS